MVPPAGTRRENWHAARPRRKNQRLNSERLLRASCSTSAVGWNFTRRPAEEIRCESSPSSPPNTSDSSNRPTRVNVSSRSAQLSVEMWVVNPSSSTGNITANPVLPPAGKPSAEIESPRNVDGRMRTLPMTAWIVGSASGLRSSVSHSSSGQQSSSTNTTVSPSAASNARLRL